jgi:plastocyanin
MKRLALVVAALALAMTAAAAAAGPTTLRISADPGGAMKFTRKALSAHPGRVTIVMQNPAVLPHNVAIKGNGVNVKGKIVLKGGTSSVTAVLKKGTYRFYCSVPGHEAAGMWGTLVVR